MHDLTAEGVFKGLAGDLAGELEVAGTASPLTVQPGAAICYGLYMSDAEETLAVSTPAVDTTGFRVVLRTNWAGTSDGDVGEAQTRLAVVESADGVASIPALTQSFGTVWEISLATGTITTGGTITVTDDRTFRKATGITDTAELEDAAVTLAKLASAVAAQLVTNGDSHDHAGGDGAQIPTGGIENDAVTPAKLPNRTRKFVLDAFFAKDEITGAHAGVTTRGWVLPDGEAYAAFGHFAVPEDFVSGLSVKAVVIPASSGDIFSSTLISYGADGESWNNHSESTGDQAIAVTSLDNNFIQEVSLPDAAKGDVVSIQFTRTASNANDTIDDAVYFAGWIIEYTADS